MKVPLRELEEARRDPGAYVRRRRAAAAQKYIGFKSKYLTLQRAVYRFHRSNNDLQAAQEYLEQSYLRQFKRPEQLAIYAEQLGRYADAFKGLGTTAFRVKDRLVVPLPKKLTDAGMRVSGEIPRVDLTAAGYTAWLFAKKTDRWEDELRLPVIQVAYARELGADEEEIKVGIYDFSKGEHKLYEFSARKRRAAQSEVYRLLRQMLRLSEGDKTISI